MNAFDSVIGYDSVKLELLQIIDMIRSPEIYSALGASTPRGVLLHGEPGVGKTVMAKAFLQECGLPNFTVRCNTDSKAFCGSLSKVFREAADAVPSVILLDDMDKFSPDEDDKEAFHVIQSCIDEVAGVPVYVIATVNDLKLLPDSLSRAGRFDRYMEMSVPTGADAAAIVAHYMASKPFVGEVNADDVAKMLYGRTCAQLETILNEAAIYAGYARLPKISMQEIVRAHLADKFVDSAFDKSCPARFERICCHEAGHAAMLELLLPGSVGFLYADHRRGFVPRCCDFDSIDQEVLSNLAGKAASELVLGTYDPGCSRDLTKAQLGLSRKLDQLGAYGMAAIGSAKQDSEALCAMQNVICSAELERSLYLAREILTMNRELLDKLSAALREKGCLLHSEVQAIRASCTVALPRVAQ